MRIGREDRVAERVEPDVDWRSAKRPGRDSPMGHLCDTPADGTSREGQAGPTSGENEVAT
jgi:hypothetical protein